MKKLELITNLEYVSHDTYSMQGRVSEEGRSYTHKIGYIEGSTDHSFVILTESHSLGNGQIPYTQEKMIPELFERVSGFIV